MSATAEKRKLLVNLSQEQQTAAREKLSAWFSAWQRQAWGTLASQCQLPQAIAKDEMDICVVLEQRLSPYHLSSFVIGEVVEGATSPESIAYADFDVIAVVLGKRVGIRPRVIFDGKKWGVNFTSINRRFTPQQRDGEE